MPHLLRSGFNFGLSPDQLAPIIQMQMLAKEDSVLRNFSWQSLMQENLMRRQSSENQAAVIAQAANAEVSKTVDSKSDKAEKEASRSYTISYFNPELGKTEVLEGKTSVMFKDPATQAVEEAVAAGSVLSIYRYIGMPLIRTEVIPWKLQQILDEREYGTPPPPPAGAAAPPVRLIEEKESEIVAVRKREDIVKAALDQVVIRKEKSEAVVAEELLMLEETVEALRRGDPLDKLIAKLPPLSRARYLLLLRKKNMGRYAVIQLLLREIMFLKGVQKKLELFTLDDLVNMFKMIRQLQTR